MVSFCLGDTVDSPHPSPKVRNTVSKWNFLVSKEYGECIAFSPTLQSSDKPFFFDFHWHLCFPRGKQNLKVHWKKALLFLPVFRVLTSFVRQIQLNSTNILKGFSRKDLVLDAKRKKGKQDILFSRNVPS